MTLPLLTAALPGFRAWMVDAGGRLHPYTGQSGAWEVGVNTAACARGGRHVAPHQDCMCGLYAFHHLHPQLRGEPVVGAIAAWGDMEVHRDGFRAQHASVIALASNGRGARAAAARYGVPLVPRAALPGLATLATGALPPSLVERPDANWLARRRGYADQIWVEASGGVVTLGISPAMAEWLAPGQKVENPGRVRGRVLEVNDAPAPAPADPDGGCWIARIAPSHWEEDCRAFTWGPAGRAEMVAEAERSGAVAWEHLIGAPAAGPRSWREVRELMAAWRAQAPPPRFASAAEFYDEVAIPLGQALAGDRSLTRLDVVLGLTLEAPDARLVLDLRRGRLHTGRGPTPEIEASLKADDFVALVEGRLDLARESRTGRLRIRGSLAQALSCLAIVAAWARPHVAAAR